MANTKQRFRLDPDTVKWESRGGSEDSWRTFHGYKLIHVPTGSSVEKELEGKLTREQMHQARERMWRELWRELEDQVARYLKVSQWRARAPHDVEDIPPDPLFRGR